MTGYKRGVGNKGGAGWFQEACDKLSCPRFLGLLEV